VGSVPGEGECEGIQKLAQQFLKEAGGVPLQERSRAARAKILEIKRPILLVMN
jgi:hypothetical protein